MRPPETPSGGDHSNTRRLTPARGTRLSTMSLTSPPAQNAFPPVPRITSSLGSSSSSSPPSPRPPFVAAALEGKCSSRASCMFRSIPMERAFMRSGTLRVRRATPRPSPRISRVTSCRTATKRAGKNRRRGEQGLRSDGRRREQQRLEPLTVCERMVSLCTRRTPSSFPQRWTRHEFRETIFPSNPQEHFENRKGKNEKKKKTQRVFFHNDERERSSGKQSFPITPQEHFEHRKGKNQKNKKTTVLIAGAPRATNNREGMATETIDAA